MSLSGPNDLLNPFRPEVWADFLARVVATARRTTRGEVNHPASQLTSSLPKGWSTARPRRFLVVEVEVARWKWRGGSSFFERQWSYQLWFWYWEADCALRSLVSDQ
jgi:hypothetical protein